MPNPDFNVDPDLDLERKSGTGGLKWDWSQKRDWWRKLDLWRSLKCLLLTRQDMGMYEAILPQILVQDSGFASALCPRNVGRPS